MTALALPGRRLPRLPGAVIAAGAVLAVYALIGVLAPAFVGDIRALNLPERLLSPDAAHWFGTDQLGRDVFGRTLYGTRNSLIVGFAVAIATTLIGVTLGIVTCFSAWTDRIAMRLMDGLMAIPGVLLAIAMVAIFGSSLQNVVIAITVPEIPRMVRLVRSVTLTVREQPFIAAAISIGTPLPRILWRHVLPNVIGAVMVQATYTCASAIISEAVLSFLGAGTPPEIPSWGNMMAEGRQLFQVAPWIIAFPGIFLAVLVLAVNLAGDGLRQAIDPKLSRRVGK
ncbi:MAG: ABC transporter permease [Ferrovibrionaceae bacterium]